MEIAISFELGHKENQLEILKKILELLNGSFLPKPKLLWVSDKDEQLISSFIDPVIFEEIENLKKKSHIHIFNNLRDTSFFFKENSGFNCETQEENVIHENSIKNLFMSLLKMCRPIYAEIDFSEMLKKMHRQHYIKHRRKGHSSGLGWLQYYAGEELRRQGSIEEIEQNPFIKTERIHDGILVQVGESIYDSLTPEGEALLVKATEAMPPEGWNYTRY